VKALLATPSLAKTTHFSLHAAPWRPVAPELPTGAAPDRTESVDNGLSKAAFGGLSSALTLVVPKRHARRAATRNLVKRQMREAARRRAPDTAAVTLLIRQRSGFSAQQFPSATSAALRAAVRRELDELFDQAWAAR
jgi:ribonuclease P protein component